MSTEAEELARLSAEATEGLWRWCWMDENDPPDFEEDATIWYVERTPPFDAPFIVALVNAYRSGRLVHVDDVEPTMAEVREVLRGNARVMATAEKLYEENGWTEDHPARRLLKPRRDATRALLAKIDGAKG